MNADGTPPGSDDVCFDFSIERVYTDKPSPVAITAHPIRFTGNGMISVIGRVRY